jgi:hypothetical protein
MQVEYVLEGGVHMKGKKVSRRRQRCGLTKEGESYCHVPFADTDKCRSPLLHV